ncbi:hypothetical protein CBOM_01013 [Ceraceosorus bombacis]|uniref:Uncharacterized protein n=1 Tax=Ceraceosorus bombacis TaxID=401625 RepID=A0A0P1BCC0_9BASI|nr:hypothetical protein CBOM_01013 [Ceraceosorus bombacis]
MRFSHLSTIAFALLARTSLAAPYGGTADKVAQAAVSASEHARNEFDLGYIPTCLSCLVALGASSGQTVRAKRITFIMQRGDIFK